MDIRVKLDKMGLKTKSENINGKAASKKWLFFTTSLGILVLLLPVVFIFLDPLLMFVRYYLRLANGTYLHNLMLSKLEGPRIYVSLFNITNAKEYMSGEADKMKLEENGPFVYQEYRINQNSVLNPETELLVYTPRIWAEFIPEESITDPKDIYITVPSIPMLQGADMMSKYSFFLRNLFNVVASSIHSKAIVNITAHEYLWGYPEPLIKLANTAVPGLFYYNSSGIMERLYDVGAKYTIELGIRDDEKFSVKKVTKFRKTKNKSDNIIDRVQNFTNAFEGAAFPPGMTPDTPVNIYRHSVCKIFKLQYTGTKTTEYGSKAFTYDIANETLNDHELCLENGKWCPDGLLNLAPCYFNFPFAISRGHFLDVDPKVLERYEGLKPDRALHSTEMVIDPEIGVAMTSKVSIQLNLALGDIGYNAETRRLKDTVLPVCHARLKHPKLPSLAIAAFLVLYSYKSYIVVTITTLCLLAGFALLAYSTKAWYWNKLIKRKTFVFESTLEKNAADSYFPLIK